MIKINEQFKWLARDNSGDLWAYKRRPIKMNSDWFSPGAEYTPLEESDSTYSFIKWEDEEPTKIEDVQEESEQEKTETVNKPSHYIGVNGMEVEEVLQEFLPKINDGYVAHRVGSAIEYLLRHPEKNGDEDILKAEQNIKQIADYNLDIKERKKVALEDSQQESAGQKIIKEIEGSLQGTVDGNEMNEFLKALANTDKKPEWTEYLVPNSKVSTFYGGTNLND